MGLSQAQAEASALKVLHYTAPLISFLFFALASLWSVCALQNLGAHSRKKLKVAILAVIALILLISASEAVVITAQLLSGQSSFATHHENIYSMSELLLWLVMFTVLWGSQSFQWYPYYGTWMLAIAFDLVLVGLSGRARLPVTPLEWSQVVLHASRLLLTVLLLAVYFASTASDDTHDDEEASPLLRSQDSKSKTQTKGAAGYGSVTLEQSALAAENDYTATEAGEELQERKERLTERLKEKGNWLTYIRDFSIFLPLIWPTKRPLLQLNLVGVGLCVLASRVLAVLAPLQLGILINSLASGLAKEALIALSFYILVQWLDSYAGIEWLREFLWIPVEMNAMVNLEVAAYSHIMELSCDFHDQKQSGELYTSVSQGEAVVELLDALLYQTAPLLMDLTVACFYFYFLFDEYLVLIGISVIILYLWIALSFTPGQADMRRQNNVAQRRKAQVMYDTLGGWRTVAYFNRIPHAQKAYEASVRLYQNCLRRARLSWDVKNGILHLVLDVCGFLAFAYGVHGVIYGGKPVGAFVTLITYWGNFTGQLPYLASMERILMQRLVDAEELLRLFQTKPSIVDGPNEFSFKKGLVQVEKVSFSYGERNEIIRDVTFHARPGQTIALVGETGAGKSTILKLMFRLYDVTSGSISIDGQDIRDVTLTSLREHIGVVPQDPTLFNDTIMANVRYAKLDATDDEVMEACRTASVHDKVMSFKDGYATKVGERGIKLSGGELQRVAIARAVLKDPPIIFLDEATSSVDSETEAKIQEGLLKLSKGRTTFIVAHRLSTIMNADRIMVVRDGTVVESGTPRQLMKSKGKYYHLWTRQLGLIDSGSRKDEDVAPKDLNKEKRMLTDRNCEENGGSAPESSFQASQGADNSPKGRAKSTTRMGLTNDGNLPASKDEKTVHAKTTTPRTITESAQANLSSKPKTSKRHHSKSWDATPIVNTTENRDRALQVTNGQALGSSEKSLEISELEKPEQGEGKEHNEKRLIEEACAQPHLGSIDAVVKENTNTQSAVQETCVGNGKVSSAPSEVDKEEQSGQQGHQKLPLAKAVRSLLNQQMNSVRLGNEPNSLTSIEETEEEACTLKLKEVKSLPTAAGVERENDATARGRQSKEAESNGRGILRRKQSRLFSSEEPGQSYNQSEESTTTAQSARKQQNKEASTSQKQYEKRSFSGRKKFKPRPEAPEFIPRSQRKGSKSSQTTQSGSSSQNTSQELGGILQLSGNIKRDASTRRLQAKSDPTGQSLKRIHDEWMAGLGENMAFPENLEVAETSRPGGGPNGHVVSRSTPYSGKRRRGRSRKNRVSSTGSAVSMASVVDATSQSDAGPTPPVLVAPNPTPTGFLTPAGESPRRAAGGVHFMSDAK